MEFDQELSRAEFVGIHGVKKDFLHARHGQVFAVKFRRHRTPHFGALDLKEGNGDRMRRRKKRGFRKRREEGGGEGSRGG